MLDLSFYLSSIFWEAIYCCDADISNKIMFNKLIVRPSKSESKADFYSNIMFLVSQLNNQQKIKLVNSITNQLNQNSLIQKFKFETNGYINIWVMPNSWTKVLYSALNCNQRVSITNPSFHKTFRKKCLLDINYDNLNLQKKIRLKSVIKAYQKLQVYFENCMQQQLLNPQQVCTKKLHTLEKYYYNLLQGQFITDHFHNVGETSLEISPQYINNCNDPYNDKNLSSELRWMLNSINLNKKNLKNNQKYKNDYWLISYTKNLIEAQLVEYFNFITLKNKKYITPQTLSNYMVKTIDQHIIDKNIHIPSYLNQFEIKLYFQLCNYQGALIDATMAINVSCLCSKLKKLLQSYRNIWNSGLTDPEAKFINPKKTEISCARVGLLRMLNIVTNHLYFLLLK